MIEDIEELVDVFSKGAADQADRIAELEAKVEALEAGICEHIEWAEKVVDCDALAALLTGGEND